MNDPGNRIEIVAGWLGCGEFSSCLYRLMYERYLAQGPDGDTSLLLSPNSIGEASLSLLFDDKFLFEPHRLTSIGFSLGDQYRMYSVPELNNFFDGKDGAVLVNECYCSWDGTLQELLDSSIHSIGLINRS